MQRSKTFHFSGTLIDIYTKKVRLFALDFYRVIADGLFSDFVKAACFNLKLVPVQ